MSKEKLEKQIKFVFVKTLTKKEKEKKRNSCNMYVVRSCCFDSSWFTKFNQFNHFENVTPIKSKEPTYFSFWDYKYFLPKTFDNINFNVVDT